MWPSLIIFLGDPVSRVQACCPPGNLGPVLNSWCKTRHPAVALMVVALFHSCGLETAKSSNEKRTPVCRWMGRLHLGRRCGSSFHCRRLAKILAPSHGWQFLAMIVSSAVAPRLLAAIRAMLTQDGHCRDVLQSLSDIPPLAARAVGPRLGLATPRSLASFLLAHFYQCGRPSRRCLGADVWPWKASQPTCARRPEFESHERSPRAPCSTAQGGRKETPMCR